MRLAELKEVLRRIFGSKSMRQQENVEMKKP
jgi:hypothetical protein